VVSLFAAAMLAIAVVTGPASAQDRAFSDPPAEPPVDSPAPDPSPSPTPKDVGDVWRHVRRKPQPQADADGTQSAKKPFFFATPSFSSKPSTGLQLGIAASVVFIAGDPETTHISSADWSATGSQKGQAGTGLRFRLYMPDNGWFLQGDNRLAWTSLNTYALGIVADASTERLKYNRFRVYDTLFRRVTPRLFAGFGINVNDHTNIRAASGPASAFAESAYAAYTDGHGFPIDHQVAGGTNVGMLLDTRDNAINAGRGWYAGATYRTFFEGFLGGDSTWQLLEVEARHYISLSRDGRQKLAFWTLGEFVTGGDAPFLDLPAVADDMYGRSARGYTTGRYRGPHLVYGEAEYRATLTANGLFGAVGFVNTTAVDGDAQGQRLFATVAPAVGGGLRIQLSKRSKANLCIDYGWGTHGSRGLYLAARETF